MANSMLSEFCGSTFWNRSLTWDTDDPELTTCFEKTALVWIPCFFLWIFSIFEVCYMKRSKKWDIPWNYLNISKLTINGGLVILTLADMVTSFRSAGSSGSFVNNVDIYSPLIKACSFGLAGVILLYNRKYGLQTSGLLFIFWFLSGLCGASEFRSNIRGGKQEKPIETYYFYTNYIIYPLIIMMVVINCFPDKKPRERKYPASDHPCPEEGASFLSRISFSWFDPLAFKGFKKPLEIKDLWDVNTEDSAKELVPAFEKHWENTLKKYKSSIAARHHEVKFKSESNHVDFTSRAERKVASVLPAIFKCFGPVYLFGASLKLFNDILLFVNPQVLSLLISHVREGHEAWKGYFYALLLFSVGTIQTLLQAQYFNRMFTIGLRIRTVIISTIYRKALRISNKARKESTVGEIVNLMAVDAKRFMDSPSHMCMVWSAPFQICLSMYFLWKELGPSTLVGLAVMVLLIPLNGFIINKSKTLQIKQMKSKDERVRLMNEILSGIKVLKLYAWEPSFENQVLKIRDKEIKVLKESAYLNAGTAFIWSCAPFMMVRTYKKQTNRADISEGNMKNAIQEVLSKRMSQREASRCFDIKRGTLLSRIKKLRDKYSAEQLTKLYKDDSGNESDNHEEVIYSSKYSVAQVFTTKQEEELVKYIKTCSDMNYGLTYKQIRVLAYEYSCIIPGCKKPVQWQQNKTAGLDWIKSFMNRHKTEISLRKPENTSLARATGFNKTSVSEFFDNYVSLISKHKFKAEQIYNLDETGITTVLNPQKIVSVKGKKQIGVAASAERGELTTFVPVINAIGHALPPVYLYPRIRNPDSYLINAPTSSIALGNRNGWMTAELFPKVLEHIKQHTNCSKEKKILLLMDNHESHISVTAVNYCRDNGIVVLSFPPHTSHKLQPLDVGVFGPFKTYCSVAFNDWLTSHPGKVITIREIAELSKIAFQSAFTQKNIVKAFEKPGIWPLNRLAFTDDDFIASYANVIGTCTIEKPVSDTSQEVAPATLSVRPTLVYLDIPSTSALPKDHAITSTSTVDDIPSDITIPITPEKTGLGPVKKCGKFIPTPDLVRPFPRPCIKKKKNGENRKGKSRIYTDTPEKDRLEQLENERGIREKKKEEKKIQKVIKQVFPTHNEKNKPHRKRKISESSSDSNHTVVLESDDVSDESEGETSPILLRDDDIIYNNDFLLVKFNTKVKVIYYIARVISAKSTEFEVKFLRRKKPLNTFFYPPVDDISIVERDDIVLKLPEPNSAKTARTASLLTFNINLSAFDVN